jgi:hypothetical protein
LVFVRHVLYDSNKLIGRYDRVHILYVEGN